LLGTDAGIVWWRVRWLIVRRTKNVEINLDIAANLRTYLGAREPTARYTSFDHCFNFFQSHHVSNKLPQLLEGENLMQACLQLGFYLASWGMLFEGQLIFLEEA
jgi:hypothetical protein